MPSNAVKVDRTTKWGNPFVVGKHGTAAECVRLYELLVGGLLCLSSGNLDDQDKARQAMEAAREELHGKDLACWCKPGNPCHADVLLQIANPPPMRPN